MQKFLLIFAGFTLFSCSYTNTLTNKERKEGWKSLYDGHTALGWHRYGGGTIERVWETSGGVLCVDTMAKKSNPGEWDIVTDDEYENFDLKLEWRISPNGNSGIMFNVNEDKSKYSYPWQTGAEMQVLDNNGHPDGKIQKHHAGDLFDIIASSKEMAKPVGQWNEAEIKILNGKLDLYLNGENIISTIMWDENWKRLIANSKFKTMTGFATYRKGRICLQDHGNAVCYRNIRIKVL